MLRKVVKIVVTALVLLILLVTSWTVMLQHLHNVEMVERLEESGNQTHQFLEGDIVIRVIAGCSGSSPGCILHVWTKVENDSIYVFAEDRDGTGSCEAYWPTTASTGITELAPQEYTIYHFPEIVIEKLP